MPNGRAGVDECCCGVRRVGGAPGPPKCTPASWEGRVGRSQWARWPILAPHIPPPWRSVAWRAARSLHVRRKALLSIKPPKMSKIAINGNCAPRYPLGPGVWPRVPSPRAGTYPKAQFVIIAQGLVPTAPVCAAKSSKSAPERCTGGALARRWRKYHALGHAPRLPPGPRAAAGAAPPPLRGLVRASRA
jgi:hypothetical protein